MSVTLHRCAHVWLKRGPCWRVQKALDEQAIYYELVKGPNRPGKRDDLERLLGAVEIARDIFTASAFSDFIEVEVAPGPGVVSKADLEHWARRSAGCYWHAAGTCKMGSGPEAVLDERLKVRGVHGLRVADASVMPTVVSGNPHAAITMIAERAADFLLTENRARPDTRGVV